MDVLNITDTMHCTITTWRIFLLVTCTLSAIIHCRLVSRGLTVRISVFCAPRVPWSVMKLSLRSAPLLIYARPSALRVSAAIVWRPVMRAIAEFGLVDKHGNGSRGPCSSGGLPEGHRRFAG